MSQDATTTRTGRELTLGRRSALACVMIAGALLGVRGRAAAQPQDLSAELALDPMNTLPVQEEVYELGTVMVPFPGAPSQPGSGLPAELTGLVIAPQGARGAYPLAIFIHGQAPVCVDAELGPNSDVMCANGKKVPNYRGYARYQRALAARGFVTLSVSQNSILGSMVAEDEGTATQLMASVVEEHLKRWSAWAGGQDLSTAPQTVQSGVLPDLSQLLLIGHSRGGAASNQVALRSVTESLPWRVRAQVLLAPTATHSNPAPTVPVVVLLPECDGDVTNLQGQAYVDRARDLASDTALRSAVLMSGANHKYFNSEWDAATATVPEVGGDDATTLGTGSAQNTCATGAAQRLSGEQQRALGELFITAAALGLVRGNERVLPLLDGSAACAGPSCGAAILTSALGGRKQPILVPQAGSLPVPGAGASLKTCLTTRSAGQPDACVSSDMPKVKEVTRTPHFVSAIPVGAEPRPTQEPSAVAVRVDWSAEAVPVTIPLTSTQIALDATQLALRIIAPPGVAAPTFDVALIDAQNKALPLGSISLKAPTNPDPGTGVYWAQEARLPLTRSADMGAPTALQLVPRTNSGYVWLLDAWSYASGSVAITARSVARFEVAGYARPAASPDKVVVPLQVFGQLNEAADVYYYVVGAQAPNNEGRFSIPVGMPSLEIELPASAMIDFVGIKNAVTTRLLETPTVPQAQPQEPEVPQEPLPPQEPEVPEA